ncbi:Receptor-like protein kinase family [Quillaja saponaria]|uniref:Receptor-like protein kinase family n=1 Tax=Quillaja saponaria TaxID=32244 RepID=A0AAD7LTI7_QUISA|nr:Receptor-like protein kinase family [Quillaja saponaria]
MDIKKTYAITEDWQGDPCIPANFSWNGLSCSDDTMPRIIFLEHYIFILQYEIITGVVSIITKLSKSLFPASGLYTRVPNMIQMHMALSALIWTSARIFRTTAIFKNPLRDPYVLLVYAAHPQLQTLVNAIDLLRNLIVL